MTDSPQETGSAGKSKPRSPSYPAIDIETALQRAQALYDAEHGNAAPFEVILSHWGYNPKSGGGRLAFSALKKFGLLTVEGLGTKARASLSPLALKIILDRRPDSKEREQTIREAALMPSIHKELWEKYPAGLPSDVNLDHELRMDRKFTDSGAQEFIRELHSTWVFAKLASSGKMSDEKINEEETNGGGERDGGGGENPPFIPPPNPKMTSYPVPVAKGENVIIQAVFPLSEDKWKRMVAILRAMKPSLVDDEKSSPDSDQDWGIEP
jgi:hypothetical protein